MQLISMHSWLRHGNVDTSKTVNEALAGQVAVIGENMKIRRFAESRMQRTVL